jgi:predicted HD phosphohydrolase
VADQIAMIRDLGHADEDYEREEAERARDQSGRRLGRWILRCLSPTVQNHRELTKDASPFSELS